MQHGIKRFTITFLVGLAAAAFAFVASGCATSVHSRSAGFDSKRVANSTLVLAPVRSVDIAAPHAFDRLWGRERRVEDSGAAFLSELFSRSFRHVMERGALVYDASLKGDTLFHDTITIHLRDTTRLSNRKARDATRREVGILTSPEGLPPLEADWGDRKVEDSVRQSYLRSGVLQAAGHTADLSLVITRLYLDTVKGYVAWTGPGFTTSSSYTVQGIRVPGAPMTGAAGTKCIGDEVWIRVDYMLWDHQSSSPAAFGRVDRMSDLGCFAGRGAGITRYKWLHVVDQATRDIVNNTPFAGYKASGLPDPLLEYEQAQEELRVHHSMDYFKAYMDEK